MRPQHALDRRGFEQPLEHPAGPAMLQTLVRGERVLSAIPSVAKLAHVQRIRLFVLVLKMSLQRVVAAEGASAVGALLGLVNAPRGGRRHPDWSGGACNSHGTERGASHQRQQRQHAAEYPNTEKQKLKNTEKSVVASGGVGG